MNSYNQTSPLLQNSSTFGQCNNTAQDNYAPFGIQSFANQQQWNGNQFQNQGHNQRNQVAALREVEHRAQQSQDALHQERQQGSNYQTTRQTADIIANNADISRRIIEGVKQEIRNRQQYANSPMERHACQQREQLLEQLAQIKDQLRYLAQQRTNVQDNCQRENLTEQLMGLARQAQYLACDIINETMNQYNGNQIQTPFYPQSYGGNRQGNLMNAGQYSQNQAFLGNFQQSSPYNNFQ
ncbi:hypothetical protein DSO57_1016239 [Entomophthora muscae]|uniref:Uncharacterized protein n=2 Tax=Entomophthora muscae TaxID=34485 RepID=A0ACC2S6P7_9FUNG|nr:hypothetical protein DSO57_1016238 [Entomophthora muscae]KAJ9058067.1 hypothetical protein DSO57_1016239 [Entomophthora muscae]